MFLIERALHNPYAIAVIALAILTIGITVLFRIPVDILPQLSRMIAPRFSQRMSSSRVL